MWCARCGRQLRYIDYGTQGGAHERCCDGAAYWTHEQPRPQDHWYFVSIGLRRILRRGLVYVLFASPASRPGPLYYPR